MRCWTKLCHWAWISLAVHRWAVAKVADNAGTANMLLTGLQTCEVIAKALGIDVHVFESQRGEGGKRVGDNGWYDPKDGSIHIDLYAGQNGEGVMVFTLAHELVHFIKDWSPVKFRKLAGFLAEQYGKKGVSVHDLVLEQQAKAADKGRKLSFEQAYEEWVADSMETMLADGKITEKLALLQATDKTLLQKIKACRSCGSMTRCLPISAC